MLDLFYINTIFVTKPIMIQGKPTIRRVFEDDVALNEAYIIVVLGFAERRLSKILVSILAHAVKYGKIDKDVKQEIASKMKSNTQVVANGITRLRKLGYLNKDQVNERLCPPKDGKFILNLVYEKKA
jgi:hypothetical protein